jgi:hypothetical protein
MLPEQNEWDSEEFQWQNDVSPGYFTYYVKLIPKLCNIWLGTYSIFNNYFSSYRIFIPLEICEDSAAKILPSS